MSKQITQEELESYLWGSAVLLRNHIDAGSYKQYIFPLLFFKRLNDVYEEETAKAIEENGPEADSWEETHSFVLPKNAHWNAVRNVTQDVGKAIQDAFRAIEKANELAASIPGSLIPGQFENPQNPQAHYETTGPELWEQSGGELDVFVAGIGTGGTLTGTGRFLREKKPSIQLVGVEPAGSPVLTQGKAGSHGLQGIGAGFVPAILDTALYNQVLTCQEESAYAAAREFARKEGILVGISSGAALWAACQIAAQPENAGKTIAVLLPDTGDRYLSTPLFKE